MCGRYSLVCIDDLGNRFRVFNPMMGARSRFNVSPGNEMPVLVRAKETRLVMMQWGLIPHWARAQQQVKPLINARVETLSEKPSFKNLLAHHRCLIPASGFFEWKAEGHRKTPFYFSLTNTPCFAFAGLYDEWRNPSGKKIATYTIITTAANDLVAGIHTRMPVILKPDEEDRWLSQEPVTSEYLKNVLVPYPAADMVMVPVSPLVNNPSNDDDRVIAPLNSLDT